MKLSRVITLFAALVIAGVFTWALARQQVGAQEAQSIEAAAP